jgi:hypothetical protein
MSKRITAFQWGYEGWGNATKQLIKAFDRLEKARGFELPIFVDVRYSRSVRAAGFRERAFENLLGHSRYRWMRSLGNAAIGTGQVEIVIQCKDAAQQLLDLVIDAAESNRRVIFFCSCPSPECAGTCHRATVAKLLIRAARSRKVAFEVQEWPGTNVTRGVAASLEVTNAELRRVRRGSKTVSLTRRQISPALMGLAHGALVELHAPAGKQVLSIAPPIFRGGGWRLPIFLFPPEEEDTANSLWPHVIRLRKKYKLEVRST